MAATHDTPEGAWLFVDDDDGGVVRIDLDGSRVHIGRDRSNDIWIEHPGCATHALVLYRRDDVDHIKVYEGATVHLNGVAVTGMHRLYGGDTVRVTDRTFLYGRDDTPPEQCLGLTVFDGDDAVEARVLRQTRVVIGRKSGDVQLDDASVSDPHVTLEFYADDGLFLLPAEPPRAVKVGGAAVTGRVRLDEDAQVQLGRVTLRVSLLPSDAHGLMAPLERARLVQGSRHRIDAPPPAHAGTPRGLPVAKAPEPAWIAPPPDAVVPETVIGSLAQMAQESDALPGWLEDLKEDRPAQPPRPLPGAARARPASAGHAARPQPGRGSARASPRPTSAAASSPTSAPKPAPKPAPARSTGPRPAQPRDARPAPRARPQAAREPGRRSPPPGPSVRVSPEVFQGRQIHHDSQALRVDDVHGAVAQRRQGGRSGTPPRPMPAVRSAREQIASAETQVAASPLVGLHEQMTDVLQTNDVQRVVAEHYRKKGLTPPPVAQPTPPAAPRSPEPWPATRAPSPAEERYRPSREGKAAPARRSPTEAYRRGDSAAPMPPMQPVSDLSASHPAAPTRPPPPRPAAHRGEPLPPQPLPPVAEGGIYRPSRQSRGPSSSGWQAQPQLTGVLDVIPDKARLDRDVHVPDPDALAQQQRVSQARARRRGEGDAPVAQGYSHHDPTRDAAATPARKGPPRGGDVDRSPRRRRTREVDNSPRYYDDEER